MQAFESAWSAWLGVKFSVFVNSGSSANLLSLALLKQRFPEGGEVIVPPLTWVSDISSVLQLGFTPVFADIDSPDIGNGYGKDIGGDNRSNKGLYFCLIFKVLTPLRINCWTH